MEMIITPQKITKILIIIIICLTLLSLIGQIYKYTFGYDRYLVDLFDLDTEGNIPTWYASMSLLLCSMLLAVIAFAKKITDKKYHFHWIILSILFLIFAMDEGLAFHEQTITPLRTLLKTESYLYFAWVIPAGILLIVFLISYLKFLNNLPSRTKRLFIISGILYVGSALGMELFGGKYFSIHGRDNLPYAILTNIEEFVEMVGILLFIYALMEYISINLKKLRICFKLNKLTSE
jgi:hypothetical protein